MSPRNSLDDPYKCALINMYVLVVSGALGQGYLTKVSICKYRMDTGHVVSCSD